MGDLSYLSANRTNSQFDSQLIYICVRQALPPLMYQWVNEVVWFVKLSLG